MKNRLLQAMKSLPMLAEDKEKFVNEISKNIGNNQQFTINYFRVYENGTEEINTTFIYAVLMLSMILPMDKVYIYDVGISSPFEAIVGNTSVEKILKASILHIPNINSKVTIEGKEVIINTGKNIKEALNNIVDVFKLGGEEQQLIANLVLQYFDLFIITEEEFYGYN